MNNAIRQANTVSGVPGAAKSGFSPLGNVAATLTIASAMAVGSNLVEVRAGNLPLSVAVVNGLAKGVAASYILSKTTRSTTAEVVAAAGVLAGVAYFIDAKMKKEARAKRSSVEGERV
ncbi:MAG: hypothetical protein CSA20_07805 [Deltaproteobacteria bacterium]|nr:MAG: hypothetical protein CSB23_04270 [Deltaproteobacteria bacterium]PIE72439.1 MAG: hypothetical protein CSA20_07805 [Deltaproteobacteria bacterium]